MAAAATHEVLNQPPPLVDVNLFTGDAALHEAVVREGAAWAVGSLEAFGARLGRAESFELGQLANAHPPVLQAFDRAGRRRDEVEFHPAWHEIMELAVAEGLHAAPWSAPRPGAHVARAAGFVLHAQVENGSQCPISMTYGSLPVLRRQPGLANDWLPKLLSRDYDRRFRPLGDKTGALVGMGMTEKQGGSDLRSNSSEARPAGRGGLGAEYRITGHKWFFSAPMCDAFLVLAQAPGGLSCFFMPRWTPDGAVNAIHLQRLKDKLGNRSNASSEAEFDDAYAVLLGEEGRGVPTILEMGSYTRLDCALGSAGMMRQALAQALHHAAHRSAFQRRLIDQPLMRGVLADLALEAEAATALTLRLARAFDRQDDARETAFRRLATPATKYWICKRGPGFAAEALEAIGGNGYVEDCALPRIYREMPLNSIWEGAGNIMCLDVLRALDKLPEAAEVLRAELAQASGADRRLDRFVEGLNTELGERAALEARARRIAEKIALALQGALLVRHAPPAVADAFCATRLDGDRGGSFGALPAPAADLEAILERARPVER